MIKHEISILKQQKSSLKAEIKYDMPTLKKTLPFQYTLIAPCCSTLNLDIKLRKVNATYWHAAS